MVSSWRRRKLELSLGLGLILILLLITGAESKCQKGCDLALASYYVWQGLNLTFISGVLGSSITAIQEYNREITDPNIIQAFSRINVPFSCDCINGEFLGHVFSYPVRPGITYATVATLYYSNLTTVPLLQKFNRFPAVNIPDRNAILNVTVNCSCGDSDVSNDYGLFVTYPLRPEDSLASLAINSGLSQDLLRRYNRDSDFRSGLVYIPGKDKSGTYPPLKSSEGGISAGAIAGIVIAVIAATLLVIAVFIYVRASKRRKMEASLLPAVNDYSIKQGGGNSSCLG